ncbi:MAG: GC-type dockerin domain-anchored protein, partial [Planctomycetota bacterium]
NGTVEFRGNVDIGQLTTGNSVGTSILTNNGTVFASSGADVNIDGFIPFTGKTRDWLSEGVWVIEGLTAPTFVDITSRYANPADDVPGQSPPLFNRNGGRVNAADVTLRGPSAFFAWLENSMEQNLGSLSIELGKEFQVSGDLENQGDIFVDSASTLLIAGDYTQLDGSLSVSQSGLVAVTNGDFSIGLSPEPDSLFMSDGANVNVNGDVVLGESANVEFLIFGTSSGNEYGQVEATGAVTLGGKVSVRFDPSYLPAAGDEFVLFNSLSNQMDGDLPIVEAQGLPNDLRLEAGFDGTSLILYVVDDQFRIDSIFPRRLQAAQVNEFEVRVSRLAGEAPVSEVLEYRVNGGEELFAWTAPANAGVFNAQLPALQCGDQVEFRLVVTANDGTRVSKPFQGFAAAEVVTALTTFDDPADTDLGYTTQTSVGLASGDWFIGTPGGSGPGVPAVDADGSGSAWLTGASGDVDDGGSRLITPALQVGANTVISYSYWISGADAAPFDEDDGLYVQISTDSVSFETIRSYNNPGPAWRRDSLVGGVDFNADADVFTDTVYLRFIARDRQDNGIDSIVEAGIDALLVESDLAVDTFRDTGDTNLGWSPALAGGSSGRWEIGVPLGLGRGDPETDADGSGSAWLTDPSDGLDSDVDGTSLMTSPVIEIGGGTSVSYAYWLNDEPSAPLNSDDNLTVLVSTNGGATYQAVRTYTTASPVWRRDTLVEGIDYNTDPANMSGTLRLQFRAADREVGTPTTLEAGIDDLVVTGPDCSSQCPADLAAPFGVLNFFDIQLFLSIFGDGSLDADLTGDGALNFFDIQEFLAAFNAGCP